MVPSLHSTSFLYLYHLQEGKELESSGKIINVESDIEWAVMIIPVPKKRREEETT